MTVRRTTADCFRPYPRTKYLVKTYDYRNLLKYWRCPVCGRDFEQREECETHLEVAHHNDD